ncbi:MAG TPA: hypothetical protein VHJ83_04345, partial [Micromonosporaceae bacterium]|nr:hypothetical protein [Micromonosporaceae bacterium]
MATATRLARYGFGDGARAASVLGESGLALWDAAAQCPVDEAAADVLTGLAATADPDLAAHQLQRLVEVDPAAL